ncbi:MAG: hypothetical protein KBD63_04890 [Bacteriovoracaceae bacterium]|nr:hypothetical protein [Bacteriovoracaceae bacterium]
MNSNDDLFLKKLFLNKTPSPTPPDEWHRISLAIFKKQQEQSKEKVFFNIFSLTSALASFILIFTLSQYRMKLKTEEQVLNLFEEIMVSTDYDTVDDSEEVLLLNSL